MPNFFSELSFLWPLKAMGRTAKRVLGNPADPFDLLHRINWSAPWPERKDSIHR